MKASVSCAPGQGAPINLYKSQCNPTKEAVSFVSSEKSGAEFLKQYRDDIAALPVSDGSNYLRELNVKERQIFTTLLPCAAALKHRNPQLKTQELIEEVKYYCVSKINSLINI